MKFRLTATSAPYYTCDDPNIEPKYLKEYLEKIKNADPELDIPEPVIENNTVYISLMYGSQFYNLAKTLNKELIVRYDSEKPTIEIYDDWRE